MIDHRKLSTADWLDLAQGFYDRLGRYARSLPTDAWRRPTTYIGWDCRQLVAHLTSAITINFQLLIRMAREGKPLPPDGFNIFLRNAEAVAARRALAPALILDEYDREIADIMRMYRSLTEAEWRLPAFFFVGDVDVRMLFLIQLSDNLVHERDLHVAQGESFTFSLQMAPPLLDWFLTSFRPASFRPDRADGIDRTIHYHMIGDVAGDWTMTIRDRQLTAVQGAPASADLRLTMTVEDLVDVALARAAPWVARLARLGGAVLPASRREDFAALVTQRAAQLGALGGGRVAIEGDRRVLRELDSVFWHFAERMSQTQYNLARSAYRT